MGSDMTSPSQLPASSSAMEEKPKPPQYRARPRKTWRVEPVQPHVNGIVIGDWCRPGEVDCNFYFPPEKIKHECFVPSGKMADTEYGLTKYYNIVVSGATVENGAWEVVEPTKDYTWMTEYVGFHVPWMHKDDAVSCRHHEGISLKGVRYNQDDWFG
ncbi:hypothetical protein BU16DRAFT_584065 [Lophium mytilinum]|uniref:DUF427 domain-containing protein n=1 Tax=Lophium mytilinum TaxID=390894 RepID=A0A6A6QLA4_9PEZI|nr:hypothetical protein BU16DRAFT_584065 [Lophium mytilinum]